MEMRIDQHNHHTARYLYSTPPIHPVEGLGWGMFLMMVIYSLARIRLYCDKPSTCRLSSHLSVKVCSQKRE